MEAMTEEVASKTEAVDVLSGVTDKTEEAFEVEEASMAQEETLVIDLVAALTAAKRVIWSKTAQSVKSISIQPKNQEKEALKEDLTTITAKEEKEEAMEMTEAAMTEEEMKAAEATKVEEETAMEVTGAEATEETRDETSAEEAEAAQVVAEATTKKVAAGKEAAQAEAEWLSTITF